MEAFAARLSDAGALLVAFAVGAYVAWIFIQCRRFIRGLRGERITPTELKERIDAGEDIFIVNLRRRLDFMETPVVILGALHVAAEDLEERDAEIPRNKGIVLYCT